MLLLLIYPQSTGGTRGVKPVSLPVRRLDEHWATAFYAFTLGHGLCPRLDHHGLFLLSFLLSFFQL